MQLVPSPPPSTAQLPSISSATQRWDHLKQVVDSPTRSSVAPPSTTTDLDDSILLGKVTPVQLADGNVLVTCTECSKPILESAVEIHAQNCQKVRDRARGIMSNGDGTRKRRLSDASDSPNGIPTNSKKPKPTSLILTLGDKSTTVDPQPSKPSLMLKAEATSNSLPGSAPTTPGGTPTTKKALRGPIDVDRHCGVMNEKGLQCSRSLTCKTHQIGAKRSVPHRSRPFDVLLAEWQKNTKPGGTVGSGLKERSSRNAGAALGNGIGGLGGGGGGGGGGGTATAGEETAEEGAATPVASTTLTTAPTKKKKKSNNNNNAGISLETGVGGNAGKERKTRGEGGKKGLTIVGEWGDESEGEGGAGGGPDSEEEVESVLQGLQRIGGGRGRPLGLVSGGGAGFSGASMFVSRNNRLGKLREVLGGVFGVRT